MPNLELSMTGDRGDDHSQLATTIVIIIMGSVSGDKPIYCWNVFDIWSFLYQYFDKIVKYFIYHNILKCAAISQYSHENECFWSVIALIGTIILDNYASVV